MSRTSGLVLLGLLSLGDVASLALTDGEHPPYAVAALGAALGLVSLWLVVRALRDPAAPVRLLVSLRVLSALTAVPAFVVDDVPAAAVAGAGALVVLTVVGVLLVASGSRRTVGAAL